MKLGLFGINFGPCGDPEVAVRIAAAAESAGFESVWTGEHVVLPDPHRPPSPASPSTPFLDPAVALAYIAAATERIRLGTGIIILPQRNPLVLAKELASLDRVCKGRLIFGVGAGYLKAEFEALGISFENKGARTREFLEAMVALWTEEKPSYRGRFVDFSRINAFPRPVQQPHPPIIMGGHTAPAFRRAVTQCNGWYGFGLDEASTEQCLEGLREAAARYERPPHLGELEVSVTPFVDLQKERLRRFAELGVHRLVAYDLAAQSEDQLRALIDRLAAAAP